MLDLWRQCPICNGEGQVDGELSTNSTCSPPHKTTVRVRCPNRCRSGLVRLVVDEAAGYLGALLGATIGEREQGAEAS